MVSYPVQGDTLYWFRECQRARRELEIEQHVCSTALRWARREEAEAKKWRDAHRSVVVAKRRLSAKYGAIMRKKPRARLTRLRKWIGGRR